MPISALASTATVVVAPSRKRCNDIARPRWRVMRGECGTENRDIAVEPRAGLLRELAVDGFVVLHFVGEDRDQPLARAPSARPLEMAVEIEIGDIADPHRLLQQHGKDRRVLNLAGLLECRPLHAVVPCEHPRRQVEQQLQRAVVHELAEARPVLRRHAPARNARHGGRLVESPSGEPGRPSGAWRGSERIVHDDDSYRADAARCDGGGHDQFVCERAIPAWA